MKSGGQKRLRSTCLRNGDFFSKTGSPKSSNYSEEENINDVGDRNMYPLHSAGSKFMDLNKPFGIKDATTKNIPGAEIHNDPDMEYSYLIKAHRRSMTRLVQECSRRIYEIVCPGNAEALLYDFYGSLSELPTLKQKIGMVQPMVQISSELPPSYIQPRALFAPLAQHFTMK